jgi:hypothetical protein
MTRRKAFLTAAARRRQDPIIWTIDDAEVRLISSADFPLLGSLIDALQSEQPEGMTAMQAAAKRRNEIIFALSEFIEPADRDAWYGLVPDLDMTILGEMASEVIGEYSGTNPTKAPSSDSGSSETGPSSTDGAQPEASTLPL